MLMADGTEPIEDNELLYRRIPSVYFNRENDPHPSPMAFRPRKYDKTGLSFYREKHSSPAEVASSGAGERYYVAVLRAGDLRAHGIEVVPMPVPGNPGHAELPDLRYENRKEKTQEGWQRLLAEKLCLRVEGPFP